MPASTTKMPEAYKLFGAKAFLVQKEQQDIEDAMRCMWRCCASDEPACAAAAATAAAALAAAAILRAWSGRP